MKAISLATVLAIVFSTTCISTACLAADKVSRVLGRLGVTDHERRRVIVSAATEAGQPGQSQAARSRVGDDLLLGPSGRQRDQGVKTGGDPGDPGRERIVRSRAGSIYRR